MTNSAHANQVQVYDVLALFEIVPHLLHLLHLLHLFSSSFQGKNPGYIYIF